MVYIQFGFIVWFMLYSVYRHTEEQEKHRLKLERIAEIARKTLSVKRSSTIMLEQFGNQIPMGIQHKRIEVDKEYVEYVKEERGF